MIDPRSTTATLRESLRKLGRRMAGGDETDLLVWVIPNLLACAHRPLRYHKEFGGSGLELPPEATKEVLIWVERIKAFGIRGIISLMHPKELRHYDKLNLNTKDLIELYRSAGFVVAHIPWADPAHRALKRMHMKRNLPGFRWNVWRRLMNYLSPFSCIAVPALIVHPLSRPISLKRGPTTQGKPGIKGDTLVAWRGTF